MLVVIKEITLSEYKKLREIGSLITGNTPKTSEEENYASADIAFVKPSDIDDDKITDVAQAESYIAEVARAKSRIAPVDAVLCTCIGIIGKVGVVSRECAFNQQINMVIPNSDIAMPRYVAYAIAAQRDELQAKANAAVVPILNKTQFGEIALRVPSLAEQGEIVARLDGVEALLANRRVALAALDTLVKSRFQSQFGDLRTNSMRWPRKPFTECAVIESNMVHDFTNYTDYPHIGIDSIEKNTGALKGYRTIGEDGVISGKYLFTDKHIIYSKIRPNLNKVALPDFEGLCSADAYAILPQEDICNRVYLCHVMRSPVFLNYILPFSSRTNMPKVNRKQVEGFTVPLPPIGEQNKFAAFVAAVERLRSQLTAAIASLTTLRAACMQHYFH